MSQMSIEIDVFFDEDDFPAFCSSYMEKFNPLVDQSIEYNDRVGRTLELLEKQDCGVAKKRFELLDEIYPSYLIADSIDKITDFNFAFYFTVGSDGMNFAREFVYMIATNNMVSKIIANISSDDYSNDGSEEKFTMEFCEESLWKRL